MNDFGEVLENVSLKEYTSLGIGGKARYLVKPDSKDNLVKLMNYLKNNNYKYYLLGNGTNIILDDHDFDGVIITFDKLNNLEINDNIVTAEAGVRLSSLVKKTMDAGLSSLYFAMMIPGNVGGSIVGNAGCYGHELMDYVKSVEVIDKNSEVKTLLKSDIEYGYRHTSLKGNYIVLSVTFELEKGDIEKAKEELKINNQKRVASQPLDKKNVGSIFRNPESNSAGKLIDELGLKGFQIGGAKVSEKHANFIVNEDHATFKDMVDLIEYIKSKVKEKYNIDLILEPSIVKWDEI